MAKSKELFDQNERNYQVDEIRSFLSAEPPHVREAIRELVSQLKSGKGGIRRKYVSIRVSALATGTKKTNETDFIWASLQILKDAALETPSELEQRITRRRIYPKEELREALLYGAREKRHERMTRHYLSGGITTDLQTLQTIVEWIVNLYVLGTIGEEVGKRMRRSRIVNPKQQSKVKSRSRLRERSPSGKPAAKAK